MPRSLPENAELKSLLARRKVQPTRVVRYVYAITDERQRALMVNKESHIGGVSGEFYLGWQLSCDCYWGVDMFDLDILETERSAISDLTGVEVQREQVALRDAFVAHNGGQEILNVVTHVSLPSTSSFDFSSDWDTEHAWVPVSQVADRSDHPEDGYVVGLLPVST
jgi:hypothetical protein